MVSFCAQLGYDLIQHPLLVLMPVYLHTQKAFMESVFYANVFLFAVSFLYIYGTGAPTSTPLSLPQTWI